jgi:glycosyltransferase involved in cell wall biosynthesis
MTKILHIITRLDRGGSAENTLLTCLGLAEKYDIMLVHGLSLESHMTDWEKHSVDSRIREALARGVNVIPLGSLVRRIAPVKDLHTLFFLWRLMIREKPDIVHTHSSKAGLLGRWAAKLACIPIVIHTPHGHVFYGHFGPLASKLFLVLEKITAHITDRIVALTEAERNDYIEFSVSKPHKIVTIHSGVEIARYMEAEVNARAKKIALGLNPESLAVGLVGWLLPIKGPMYLLKAMVQIWKSIPDPELVFVGKGELEGELREEALKAGVADKVAFLGWRGDVPEIMQILDILVLSSLNEGMGRVLVEAMAAGKPVVASRVGGILDLVKNQENGLLVEPGDVNGLSFAITRLLTDSKIRDKMGQKGRTMSHDFSVENMVVKIDALYFQLIK